MQLLWVRGRTPGCLQCQGQLRLLSSMTLLGARWTWAEMGTFSSFVSVFQFLCAARLTRVLGQDQGWEAKPALACHDLLTWQVWISLTRPQLRTVLVQLVKDCRVAAPGFTNSLWQQSRSFKLLNCKPVVFNVMHTAAYRWKIKQNQKFWASSASSSHLCTTARSQAWNILELALCFLMQPRQMPREQSSCTCLWIYDNQCTYVWAVWYGMFWSGMVSYGMACMYTIWLIWINL